MSEHKKAKEAVSRLSFSLRMLCQYRTDGPRGLEIYEVWNTVRKVVDSAWVEHQRLLGIDVSAQEEHLRATGWLPWHDLYDDGSDGRTDGQVAAAATVATPKPMASKTMEQWLSEDET